MVPTEYDRNKQLITLTVITLSGTYYSIFKVSGVFPGSVSPPNR